MSRIKAFCMCIGIVLADNDSFGNLQLTYVERSLLTFITLDYTQACRSIAHWFAEDHICGHVDSDHRAELLVPVHLPGNAPQQKSSQTHLLLRNVTFKLREGYDCLLSRWKTDHLGDSKRGTDTSMLVIST